MLIDELKSKGVTYWHFGRFLIFGPGLLGADDPKKSQPKTESLNSWMYYWDLAKVTIRSPLATELIYHVKFSQILYNFIEAVK